MSLKTEDNTADVEAEPVGGLDVCSNVSCSKEGLLGSYDWKWLCTPQFAGCSRGPSNTLAPPPFLAKDDKLPLLVSLIMGLQHCLAMLGGIVTVPALIAGDACFAFQSDEKLCASKEYMISASLFTSGFLTIIQIVRFKLVKGYYLGTGLLSVMGTSFTFLPIARDIVVSEIRAGRSGFEAYGAFLGTCMVAALLEIGLSFIPPKAMRKIFPPVVTGTCVSLIGMGLVATGMKYWGGGVFCAENTFSRAAAFGGPQLCTGNGEVMLGYGAPEYFGLGLSVLLMLVALNIFGSPFMKNCGVIIALFFGYIVSAIAWYTDANGKELRYVTAARIESAPWVSFPWVTTFPLGFYPPAFIPILIAFVVTSVETIGDIAASCDASQIPSTGRDAETRIQGGLLCDGFNSLIACLMTTPPNTTFSQNNGVISLTRCASRAAGLACAGWLMLFGVLAKFAGVIASIPECVLGGMTIFLFANVLVSGIAIITGSGALNRRNRFILAISLGVGLGVTAVPEWAEGGGVAAFYGGNLKHNIGLMPAKDACIVFPKRLVTASPETCKLSGETFPASKDVCKAIGGVHSAAKTQLVEEKGCVNNNGFCCIAYDTNRKMWRDTVVIIMKTPYCIGTLIALVLNAIMPHEEMDDYEKSQHGFAPGATISKM
ncbi:hypothetical protein KFE25_005230 [Diacronema lutheri]|uniref:Purine permease n=1 Tax=Diacronema lutheri TaxID=2081491 RepID=A0A8J5X8U9_DIALT|nr:hypothetical protein KFE25_005230 [Diacronema lutheri]